MADPAPVVVHFDGACQPPRRGIATWAFTVEGHGLEHEESGLAAEPFTAESTNNVAEYAGAIHALEHLASRGYDGALLLIGDSELVIRQLRGQYKVRAQHLQAHHRRLVELLARFGPVELRSVPRAANQRADDLTKLRLAEARARLGAGPAARPT